ncbi:hypothetical protein HGM15179_010278 [Zosterops borbonicus]|uniref:Uncharacterized protein n=1 Tax=Zosterops borbonicus TaxID=364589 RepID=A0A8K1GDR0_9PASS|nr:hypothetical protein HGM15179_010278 [Zosterops borbonicus]
MSSLGDSHQTGNASQKSADFGVFKASLESDQVLTPITRQVLTVTGDQKLIKKQMEKAFPHETQQVIKMKKDLPSSGCISWRSDEKLHEAWTEAARALLLS